MATVRRLSDTDVRTIFESLHQNIRPPPHLKFKIVPVGKKGLRLSPPSYEFEDGLYILLRPARENARNNEGEPRAPAHLLDWVIRDFPPETCPWSLSGPQFPQPTAIQQRYCYPRGDPIYSSRKGGALWTMYGLDGKEDVEYRLLHVYFSAKRSMNKGVAVTEDDKASNGKVSPAAKTPSPQKRYPKRPRLAADQRQQQNVLSPPRSTTTTSSFCPSPLSFADHGSCLSRGGSLDGMDSNFVTPNSSIGANIHANGGAFDEGRFHPVLSPFRPRVLLPATPTHAVRKYRRPSHPSPLKDNKEDDEQEHDFVFVLPTDNTVTSNLEPFPCDMMDDVCLNFDDEVDDEWSHQEGTCGVMPEARKDPWKNVSSWTAPRQSYQINHSERRRHRQAQPDSDERLRVFQKRLGDLHESFRSTILSAQETDQGPLLSILCQWARQVAQAPLNVHKTALETKGKSNFPRSSTTASV